MQRRHFLYSSSLLLLSPFIATLSACSQTIDKNKEIIVGGYNETDDKGQRLDKYGVLLVQPNSDSYSIISDFNVPYEVHLATLSPDKNSILVCSRKPGASLLKYDLNGNIIAELKPIKNQHFEGHGIFTLDEKYIFATASDYEKGQGKLLKLNSQDLSLIEEFSSGGIGPHELVWQSDRTIAIANTGVLTHPNSGREILNLSSIQSTVVLFDSQKEEIIHQWQVPQPGLSARHLDCMDNGDLVIGCQYKKQDQRPACIAFARKKQELIFADQKNEMLHWNMKGYTASIKSIPNTHQALISNPRGHLLTQWQGITEIENIDTPTEQLVNTLPLEFGKGLTISQDGKRAWVSKGAGELLQLDLSDGLAESTSIKIKENIWWANHLG